MKSVQRQVLGNVLQLGLGEVLGRLCSIATVILLGHWDGVVIVGTYALATTLSCYQQPLIDFGLRHVGARLMSQYPQSANEIIHRVQRRRLLMAGAALPLTLLYASLAKLPLDMKVFVFAFSASGALYALSLDWAAWGREQLYLVGLARALAPVCILFAVVVGRLTGTQVLLWTLIGNATGFLLQAAMFRRWWQRERPNRMADSVGLSEIVDSLALRRTSVMGLSIISVLAFSSIDMLMLGVMSNLEQVGLYSAAYRVLNQILVTYYLLTNVLYPQFARHEVGDRIRMLRPRILLSLFGAGVAIAVVIAVSRRPIITILFGHRFLMACPLLLLLVWAIPLDFLTSYLSSAYIAWSMEKKVLACTAVAAASNVVLNLIWIPSYGATAAAVNTLISYVIFLVALVLAGRYARELTPGPQARARLEPETTQQVPGF